MIIVKTLNQSSTKSQILHVIAQLLRIGCTLSLHSMPNLDKSRRSFLRGALLAALGSAAWFCLIANTRPVQWLEEGSYDARTRLAARPNEADKRIVIIDVDNASYHGLQEKLGRWPWSRDVHARMIETACADLVAQGRVIVLRGFQSPETFRTVFSALDVVCTPYPGFSGVSATLLDGVAAGRPILIGSLDRDATGATICAARFSGRPRP